MGLVEFHVDRVEVRTVPKLVLFGGAEEAEPADTKAPARKRVRANLPVSPAQVLAVALGATLAAFAAARLAGELKGKLDGHC
jgi:hypothetical protein